MKSENIFKIMLFTFLSSFILGGYLLENLGIKYVSEGGNPLIKIHISTYILMLTVVYLTFRKGINTPLKNLKELTNAWLASLLSIAIVIVYGLYTSGTSGMAYLLNTMVTPLLAVYLLSQLNDNHKNKLLKLLAYLVFINAMIAILEFIVGKTMIAVEFSSFSHFRSTAFLGFPLNNALITAALVPILMFHTRIPALVYFAIIVLALFAFGGRAATGIFILGVCFLVTPKIRTFIAKGVYISKLHFAILQALTFFVLIFTTLIITLTPIGERILSKLHVDKSAEARFNVYILLDKLSPTEWVFGASSSFKQNIDFYIGINVIENYIIGWIVNFGLIGTFLLFLSCYRVPVRLLAKNNMGVNVALIVFLFVSVTNNALTTKTPALLFLFSAMYLSRSIGNKK